MLDWGSGVKTIWGRRIPKILPMINGRLVYLNGFSPAEIILRFMPKWKVMQGQAQETQPNIRHGATREATLGDVEGIEKGLEESLIGQKWEEQQVFVL